MRKIMIYVTIVILNISCAQEKIEVSDIKFGDNVEDINKRFVSIQKLDYPLSKDIKCYTIEGNSNLTYGNIPILTVGYYTYKEKISKIILYINSYKTQEKIFSEIEKKHGKMKIGFPSDNTIIKYYYFDSKDIYIDFSRMIEDHYKKTKNVTCEIEIYDKEFLIEYNRLELENIERLKKEGKY